MSKAVSTHSLKQMKQDGEKIACLTAYDASFSQVLEQQGVDVILVGDSLGMVIQGDNTTLKVSLNDMIYHTRCVSRGATVPLIVVDMPFMSYSTIPQALGNAARLVREAGAAMVKLEGGQSMVETVRSLTAQGIAVCGHLGLTPQSVHQLGGYRVQGKTADQYKQIVDDALALEQAGASLLVLECVPSALAREVTTRLAIPTIGIGAGADCDGQVLVLHDMLGVSNLVPRFSRNFLEDNPDIPAAISAYVKAVKSGEFPAPEHFLDD